MQSLTFLELDAGLKGIFQLIFDATRVDSMMDVNQITAEQTTRELATKEGIFAGVSSGGAVASAIELYKKYK